MDDDSVYDEATLNLRKDDDATKKILRNRLCHNLTAGGNPVLSFSPDFPNNYVE